MNWALSADGMAYAPKHRAYVPVDSCTLTIVRPHGIPRPAPCPSCAHDYRPRHAAGVA